MVLHFGRQFRQSKNAVKYCASRHSVDLLEYTTMAHITALLILGVDLKSNRPGSEHFLHSAMAALSPVNNSSRMCPSSHISIRCYFVVLSRDLQFWYIHRVNICLHVDHTDCFKGTLPSVEKSCPFREDILCPLALKSSGGGLFGNNPFALPPWTEQPLASFQPPIDLIRVRRRHCFPLGPSQSANLHVSLQTGQTGQILTFLTLLTIQASSLKEELNKV